MKSLNGVAVAALIAAVAAPAAFAQEAVQWRVEDGGNGHWYRLIEGEMTWTGARDTAIGMGGHLATLTTAGENTFAWALTSATTCFAFLGGYQDLKDAQYSEPLGGWKWVTGEPFTTAYWYPGEPNNFAFPEDYLAWRAFQCSATWNDVPESGIEGVPTSAVVEWSADCNGDGIVDYGQILDGTFEDENHNGVPDCCEDGTDCQCLGDVNNDGQVNGADISVLLGFWGLNGKPVAADINKDGSVDGADLAQLLGSWGECK
jgi:hypothetical protein